MLAPVSRHAPKNGTLSIDLVPCSLSITVSMEDACMKNMSRGRVCEVSNFCSMNRSLRLADGTCRQIKSPSGNPPIQDLVAGCYH